MDLWIFLFPAAQTVNSVVEGVIYNAVDVGRVKLGSPSNLHHIHTVFVHTEHFVLNFFTRYLFFYFLFGDTGSMG